jgi:predicted DNA-binding transcriptional regulator AlpA
MSVTDDVLKMLVTPQQLSAELGVPITTIYNWHSRGEGPKRLRIGGKVRYRRGEIDDWLKTCEVDD